MRDHQVACRGRSTVRLGRHGRFAAGTLATTTASPVALTVRLVHRPGVTHGQVCWQWRAAPDARTVSDTRPARPVSPVAGRVGAFVVGAGRRRSLWRAWNGPRRPRAVDRPDP